MSQNNMTPEQKIEKLNEYIVVLAEMAAILESGITACSDESAHMVLSAVANTVIAVVFALRCISGAGCEVCDEEYMKAGLTINKKLDTYVMLASMIAQATNGNKQEIPDPPVGTPVQ